ncbi:MAG: IS630 family transposase [Candidatus Riflebacteria bacterium]|nr:IS630 family transposase [Candidatus Riflebacteria bacterium]
MGTESLNYFSGTFSLNMREFGYLFGAANPQTGERVGMSFSTVDTEILNIFLRMISSHVAENVHVIIVLDNAGYHGSKALQIPENMTFLKLPPYSPQLNPVERVWSYIRSHYLGNRIFESVDHILEVGCETWNYLSESLIQSICSTSWVKGVHVP